MDLFGTDSGRLADSPALQIALLKGELAAALTELRQARAENERFGIDSRADDVLHERHEYIVTTEEELKRLERGWNKAELRLSTLQETHSKLQDHSATEIRTLKDDLASAKARAQDLNATVSGLTNDLHELRQLENANDAERWSIHRKTTLPPAYGSLHNDQLFPRFVKDAGPATLEAIGRSIRSGFMETIHEIECQTRRALRDASNNDNTVVLAIHTTAHVDLLAALAQICRTLHSKLLEADANRCNAIPRGRRVMHHTEPHERTDTEFEADDDGRHDPYATCGDDTARLIFELLWGVIANLERMPIFNARLTAQQCRQMQLDLTQIDDVLRDALHASFCLDLDARVEITPLHGLLAWQCQTEEVRLCLRQMWPQALHRLDETSQWLSEQVESAWFLRALQEEEDALRAAQEGEGAMRAAQEDGDAENALDQPFAATKLGAELGMEAMSESRNEDDSNDGDANMEEGGASVEDEIEAMED